MQGQPCVWGQRGRGHGQEDGQETHLRPLQHTGHWTVYLTQSMPFTGEHLQIQITLEFETWKIDAPHA